MRNKIPPIDRVFARLEWDGECLVFTGSRKGNGYGSVGIDGRMHPAHRVVYSETIGPIPEGMEMLHSCDNPPCCNPEHLRPGTRAENMRDMVDRGRAPKWKLTNTHCPNGHPYDKENTYRSPKGWRMCRTCQKERTRVRENYQGNPPFGERTHCPQGHPYDESNTYRSADNRRYCRACIKERGRKRRGYQGNPPSKERTHCPRGHPYDQINTYYTPQGRRQCRICKKEAKRRFEERQKAPRQGVGSQ